MKSNKLMSFYRKENHNIKRQQQDRNVGIKRHKTIDQSNYLHHLLAPFCCHFCHFINHFSLTIFSSNLFYRNKISLKGFFRSCPEAINLKASVPDSYIYRSEMQGLWNSVRKTWKLCKKDGNCVSQWNHWEENCLSSKQKIHNSA